MKSRSVDFKEALQIIADIAGYVGDSVSPQKSKPQQRFREVKTTEYIYVNEDGSHWHKIVRKDKIDEDTGESDKDCYQYHMVNGQWVKGKPDTTYPYRLPEVLQAKTLFVVEGEKTADCLNEVLRAAGITSAVATTSPGGVPNVTVWEGYVERFPALAEKAIRILPDDDSPGMKYARTVAAALLKANPKADVKIVILPGLPPKGDFVDWYQADFLDEGKDESAAIETLSALCTSAEPVTLDVVAKWNRPEPAPPESPKGKQKPNKKIIGGCFADVKDEPIDWLWTRRFAKGHLQAIHGDPDSGKGYFTFWLASIVSRGGVCVKFTIPHQRIQMDYAGSAPIPSFSEGEHGSTALWSALTNGQVTPALRQVLIPSPLL